jgi:hypothetical protein
VLVAGEISVDEMAHEVPGAPAPVEVEVLHEERGDEHAHTVVHPGLGLELAHPSINDGVSRLTLPPGLEQRICFRTFFDLQSAHTGIEIGMGALWPGPQH